MTDIEIKHDPQNARRHTDRNLEVIRELLTEIGPFRSIAIDGDDIIRAGNGVYEEAKALGLKIRIVEAAPDELIAVKRTDLTGAKAERAALFDNRAAELSEWDADILDLLAEQSPDVVAGIFDTGELQAIIDEGDDLAAMREHLAGTGSGSKSTLRPDLGQGRAKIRPVLYADQVQLFEQALRMTHLDNRGQALLTVCAYYLEHNHGDETDQRQLDSEA